MKMCTPQRRARPDTARAPSVLRGACLDPAGGMGSWGAHNTALRARATGGRP